MNSNFAGQQHKDNDALEALIESVRVSSAVYIDETIFALEMERGWFEASGIGEGDRMFLHPSILAVTPR